MWRSRWALLASVAAFGGMGGVGLAQEAPTSKAGGETTLPPVVVTSPKEKISQPAPVKNYKAVTVDDDAPPPAKKAKAKSKPAPSPAPVEANSGGTADGDGQATGGSGQTSGKGAAGGGPASSSGVSGVFALGELDMVGGTAITNDAMRTFTKDSVDQSLALAPGVAASNSGGSRNEQLIFVRGFDRWQVPISVDGIRIYRPADNRFDFSAFLTPDMSEVQIAKGYTSVLNGPGGMGGAINLVTKKPQKAVEGEVQGGFTFGPHGEYEGYKTYASLGTRQSGYYAQASGIFIDNDGWFLSSDFNPTKIEDGGERDHSYKNTWQVNAKIGLTPNRTDDYSINYTRGEIARGAPYHVTDPVATQRYWDWPGTTTENFYWLSHTKVGEASFIESKLYYSVYSDILKGYDDPAQTTQALAQGKVFTSFYNDWAAGGSLTAGSDITTWDTLKLAFHYRRDVHDEHQLFNISGKTCAKPPCFDEPVQEDLEDTFSIAGENTVHINRQVDWVAGISYDWRNLMKAEEYTDPTAKTPGVFFNYVMKDSDAFNWQTALVYRLNSNDTLHASVSDRTRFPTIFERFSSRFGGATSNPDLQPEEARNYEIGYASAFAPGSQVSGAVFYSDVKDMIQSIPFIFQGNAVTQSRNVGDGRYYGIEAAFDYTISPQMLIGGNITWLRRDVNNPSNPAFELTGMPEVKGIAYMTYKFTDAWSITPNVEFASDRWTVTTDGKLYYKTGAFGLFNFQTEYDFDKNTSLMVTARNILDANYVLTDGYPEAGRSFSINMRSKF